MRAARALRVTYPSDTLNGWDTCVKEWRKREMQLITAPRSTLFQEPEYIRKSLQVIVLGRNPRSGHMADCVLKCCSYPA